MPQTTTIYHKGDAVDLCANCCHYSLIDGKPLCFAIIKAERPVPHGVQPKNRCNCGKFKSAVAPMFSPVDFRRLRDEAAEATKRAKK